jgi:hypothetical protein
MAIVAKALDATRDATLISYRIARETLQGDLLRVKLARERSELVSKAEQIATFERAGRILAREIQTMPDWAEELYAVAKTGNIAATTSGCGRRQGTSATSSQTSSRPRPSASRTRKRRIGNEILKKLETFGKGQGGATRPSPGPTPQGIQQLMFR